MNGFLDRMAARAGGVAAAVAPRVPALFETGQVAAAPTVSAEAPAPSPVAASPQERRVPVAALAPTLHAAGRAPAQVADPGGRDQPAVAARVARVAQLAPAAAAAVPVRGRAKPEPEPMPQAGTPMPTMSDTKSPAATPVPAVPVTPPSLPAASERPESPRAPQRGPDVIRVSIGRVDVRAPAAAPQPARTPASRPTAAADRLSLRDYLRGQREAR